MLDVIGQGCMLVDIGLYFPKLKYLSVLILNTCVDSSRFVILLAECE